MAQSDLLARSERLFNRLNLDYGRQDDGSLVVPTEDDRPILVATRLATDGGGRDWPVLRFIVYVLEDVEPAQADMDLLVSANEASGFGSVILIRDVRAVVVFHEAVGWPGDAEFRVTLELMASSRGLVEEFLAGRIVGTVPLGYSDLV